ncbi:MAG TPA: serine/threonine-protein kinase [Polyangiales bacterium]
MSEAGATARLAPEVREGATLSGRYLLGRTLGAGGMGVVIAARHLDLDEWVAIKFLLPEVAQGAEAVGRFAREAWAASKIKSEYVARVNDVGRLPSGAPYIVMEYLEGLDLAAMLHSRGPLPIEQAVEFVLQACEGIAEAHALGIVHRDLKPSNLFCWRRSDGLLAVKVLDFGISKITQPIAAGADLRITATATTVGSPLYMSPEQMSSAKVADARADVWALGVILQELITGTVPFCAASLPELAIKIATERPQSLRARREDVPKALERVLLRCLEKERDRRYASVAELARALAPFGPARARAPAERAERVLRASAEREPLASLGEVSRSSLGSHARLRGIRVERSVFRRASVQLLIALLSIASTLGVWFWLRTRSTPQPTAAKPIAIIPSAPAPAPTQPIVGAPPSPPPPDKPASSSHKTRPRNARSRPPPSHRSETDDLGGRL